MWFTIAVIFVIEAWLWDVFEGLIARCVALLPLDDFKQWLSDTVDRLPPQAVLLIFAIPAAVLFPVKLIEVWLIMHQQWFWAIMLIILAKLVGVGITAFVFEATREKLLQMDWFRAAYDKIIEWRDLARTMVEPYKIQLRDTIQRLQSESMARFWRDVWRTRRNARSVRPSSTNG
jgi:putative effector of murein hydrolase LrgA (UPF0299 family)